MLLEINILTDFLTFSLFCSYTSGTTHTAEAIKYARETSFSSANGMRTNAAKIAIIVTDGNKFCHRSIALYFFDKTYY